MGYNGHQAAPGGRQVRRLRRDRHQRPAEDGRAAGRADGLAVRGHRRQNLSVLTRGNTLRPVVLLLGGPNTLHQGMREGWKHNIPKIWEERNIAAARGRRPEDADQGAGERAVLRGARRGRVRQDRGRRASASTRAARSSSGTSTSAASRRRRRRGGGGPGEGRRRARGVQGASTAARSSSRRTFQPGRGGRGLRRPRRRLDLHQGRAARQGPATSSSRPTSSPRAIRSRTRWRSSRSCESRSQDQGATLEDPRRRHHRLCQGHPEGRARGRCGAGRDRRAHRVGAALLQRTST